MVNVWRVRMKSGYRGVEHPAARDFAVASGTVGAGWGLNGSAHELPDGCGDLELYLSRARRQFPGDRSMEKAATAIRDMQAGDFCWMYATHTGEYWCCRVEGPFVYRTGGDFDRHDLHMTRRCTWKKVGPADTVPGAVRRAFAGPFGTVTQLVRDKAAAIAAAEIAHGLRGLRRSADLFAEAGPEDLEDVVALYLQEIGWRVLPSTAKVSMAAYEFVLVHRETGELAGVQVKSGNVNSYSPQVATGFDKFFVFLANAQGVVATNDHRVVSIARGDLEAFARRHWSLLPRRLRSTLLPPDD